MPVLISKHGKSILQAPVLPIGKGILNFPLSFELFKPNNTTVKYRPMQGGPSTELPVWIGRKKPSASISGAVMALRFKLSTLS
jgi:hypothetical protein